MSRSPLSLSAEEMDAVLQAAGPVHQSQRHDFLVALADALAHEPAIGPGVVHRWAALLQRDYTVQARRDAETRLHETHERRVTGNLKTAFPSLGGPSRARREKARPGAA